MSTSIESKATVKQHFQETYVKKVQITDIISSQPPFQCSRYRRMALLCTLGDLVLLYMGHRGKVQLCLTQFLAEYPLGTWKDRQSCEVLLDGYCMD